MNSKQPEAEMVIEVLSSFETKEQARRAFAGIAGQDGCFGGRLIPAKWPATGVVVQVFFEDFTDRLGPLPDGCFRRLLLPDVREQLTVAVPL